MSCIFCQINEQKLPAFSVYQDEFSHAIVDKFPLSPGHIIVLSKSHEGSIDGLSEQELSAIWKTARKVGQAMKKADAGVKDVHYLINDGTAANQHVPHVHLHVIPRYGWDLGLLPLRFMTRFMNPANYLGKDKSSGQWAAKLAELMTEV